MPTLRFPLSAEMLARLPRHPDWKYERIDGEACLSHRPKHLWFIRPTGLPVQGASPQAADIRMIEPSRDRSGIVEMLVRAWAEEDPYRSMEHPEAQLRAEIERSVDKPCLGVLAVDADGVCAVAMAPLEEGVHTLAWLTVRRGARERGLATALLGVVVEHLAASGVGELASAASPSNVPSLRWHLTRGFHLAPDPVREAWRSGRAERSGESVFCG